MREIKFRAWNNLNKEMLFSVDVYSEEKESWWTADKVDPDNGNTIYSIDNNYKGSVLMQYTGLKDKNGIEIYEGDIVEYEESAPDGDSVTLKGEVYYSDEGGTFLIENSINNIIETVACADKVIGNIYENPELK